VHILGLPEDAAGADDRGPHAGAHVPKVITVCQHLLGGGGEERLDVGGHVRAQLLRQLRENSAGGDEIIRRHEPLRDVHVGPPVPAGGAEARPEVLGLDVPIVDDLLLEREVEVVAVAGVDLGKAMQDQGAAARGGLVTRHRAEPGEAQRRVLHIPDLAVIDAGGEMQADALGALVVRVGHQISSRRVDFEGLIHRVLLAGIRLAAVGAADLVRALHRPCGELGVGVRAKLPLLAPRVAVGAVAEVDAGPGGDELEHVRLAQLHQRGHRISVAVGVAVGEGEHGMLHLGAEPHRCEGTGDYDVDRGR